MNAALITAAGLSSRMGAFKPLLPIGDVSFIEKIILTFQESGVKRIVVVTGYQAEKLSEKLSNYEGVTLLHNPHFQTTQMFDSAVIGLSALKDTCDAVFITPVDAPVFFKEHLQLLDEAMRSMRPSAVVPYFEEHPGHPILLQNSMIASILQDHGENGLKGALSRLPQPVLRLPIPAASILFDADTKEEYQALLHQYDTKEGFFSCKK